MATNFDNFMKQLQLESIKGYKDFLDNVKEQLGNKIPPKLFLCMLINLTVTQINPEDIPTLSYKNLRELISTISLCYEEVEFLNEMITLTENNSSKNYIEKCEKLFEKFDKEKELSALQLGPGFQYIIYYGVNNFTFC